MAWAVKYRIEFDDQRELAWKIDISEDAWGGAITDLIGGGEPLVIEHQNDSEAFNDPIRGSQAYISAYSETNFALTDLYSVDDRQFFVQIYQGGNLYWQGYLTTGYYEEVYDQPPYLISIVAEDGLASLKDIEYKDGADYYTGRLTAVAILRDIFAKLGSDLTNFYEYINIYDDGMLVTEDDSPLEQLYIDTRVFKEMNCYEVLQNILMTFNAIIRQDVLYRIFRPVELLGATVYGRYFTGDTTKASVSYMPLQEINRTTSVTNRQQVPGGKMMLERPISKVKSNFDYGNLESLIDNYTLEAETFDEAATQFEGWTYNHFNKPAGYQLRGESSGVLLDYDSAGAGVLATHQHFGDYVKLSAADVFGIEFDWGFINVSGSTCAAAMSVRIKCGSYYLYKINGNTAGWTLTPGGVGLVDASVEDGWAGWREYRKYVVGIPDDGPLTIELYEVTTTGAYYVYGVIKNIKIFATSDNVTKFSRMEWGGPYKNEYIRRSGSQYNVIEKIVSKLYEKDNSLNGVELKVDYILGDVIDNDMDNILAQFIGSLAVYSVESFTTAATRFVAQKGYDYLAGGVTVTSSGADIIFTATVAGVNFTGATTIANVSGTLDGTVVNTTANSAGAVGIIQITLAGSSGTADIVVTGDGSADAVMTYSVSISNSIDNFIAANGAAFTAAGYTLSKIGTDILRATGVNAGDAFSFGAFGLSGDLDQSGIADEIQAASDPTARVDTVTLDTGTGTANITCDAVTKLATLAQEFTPTTNWNSRSPGSEDQPIVELIVDEIAAQGARPKHLIPVPIRDKVAAMQISVIGSFEDDLQTYGGSNRTYFINRGKFYVKARVWDIDLIEIL